MSWMFELESIALSLVLLPLIIALFWYASDFLPRNLRIVVTLASSLISWRVLMTIFIEPLLYMFGLATLTLILVLLFAIILLFIEKLGRRGQIENKILNCARKYGGVLVPEVLVVEEGFTINEGLEKLEELVRKGRALKYHYGSTVYFDFPGVRSHLSEIYRRIIEKLKDNPSGLTLMDLLSFGKHISVERALNDLVNQGIVVDEDGIYRLRAFARVRAE